MKTHELIEKATWNKYPQGLLTLAVNSIMLDSIKNEKITAQQIVDEVTKQIEDKYKEQKQ
jgi:ribosomal protein S7